MEKTSIISLQGAKAFMVLARTCSEKHKNKHTETYQEEGQDSKIPQKAGW